MSTEKFAIEADEQANKVVGDITLNIKDILTGTKPQKIATDGVKNMSSMFAQGMVDIIKVTNDLADQELEYGFSNFGGKRSFAMGSGFASKVADFYSRYVPMITGNFTSQTVLRIQNLLRKMDEQGVEVRDMGTIIGVLFDKPDGYGRNIARTEGTRAAALAKRNAAQEAAKRGYGPKYYIYKALMDERTTETCQYMNNMYWNFDDDDIALHPPRHYFCRSSVTFGWEDSIKDRSTTKLTPARLSRELAIQSEEFPKWQNYEKDMLVSPEDAIREVESSYAIPNHSAQIIRQREIDRLGASFDKTKRPTISIPVPTKQKDSEELKKEILSHITKGGTPYVQTGTGKTTTRSRGRGRLRKQQ